MKQIKFFFVLVALVVASVATAQILIIEDYFFNELPVSFSEITGMSMIATPNGTKAMGITLANPLPEAALKYAVADDSIPEAAELKQRFAEAKIRRISVSKEEKINVGDIFPEFSATDIEGNIWTNANVAGKPMVLNLWFTGCGPCRAEMSELSRWKDEMPDVMFFSATYEDAERARPVLEKEEFNRIALVNDTQFKEWIGGQGYPMTIVVNKAGTISHIEYGTSPVQREELKKKIEAIR